MNKFPLIFFYWLSSCLFVCATVNMSFASDLVQVRQRGVLRHIGIPYANFVISENEGLDVELMRRFARYLGVRYELVLSNWGRVVGDLTGTLVKPEGDDVITLGHSEIRGDVVASGMTVLDWRKKMVAFSVPTFPTQVWCVARKDFPINPYIDKKDFGNDINFIKKLVMANTIMVKEGTCLAPDLYRLNDGYYKLVNFPGKLSYMAPAMVKGLAELALLDVPDTLVALEKWPGEIKVIGAVSPRQNMAVAFRKDAPELLLEFNLFFEGLKRSGEYYRLVKKYYPSVCDYFENFFDDCKK